MCCWVGDDMHSEESIELLKTSGIDFDQMASRGIDVATPVQEAVLHETASAADRLSYQ